MADELDDLLEHLECDSASSPHVAKPEKRDPPSKLQTKEVATRVDIIDDLLDDLDSGSPILKNTEAARAFPLEKGVPALPSGSGKCFPVYLGGSNNERGMSPGRACDKLRCTKCDFEVIRIDNVEWTEACDYLFFRNFYPNRDKLKENLRTKTGCSSYACQCTWRSCSDLEAISSQADIRWICGGHGR